MEDGEIVQWEMKLFYCGPVHDRHAVRATCQMGCWHASS